MVDQGPLFEALSDLSRVLVEKYDVSDGLHDLVERSATVAGVAGAAVSVRAGDALAFASAVDESIVTIERAQEAARRGPCVDADHGGEPVVVAVLADAAERWPEVVAAATEVGVHAAAAFPMLLDGDVVGVLDLYDTEAREWSEEDLRAGRWLADMVTAYVVLDSRLRSAENLATQLQYALDNRVIIEQAKGMLAADRQISVDEAFEVLRRHSRDHNLPVREVAAAVVKNGLRLEPPVETDVVATKRRGRRGRTGPS